MWPATVSMVDRGQDLERHRWANEQVLREEGEIGRGDHQAPSYRYEGEGNMAYYSTLGELSGVTKYKYKV